MPPGAVGIMRASPLLLARRALVHNAILDALVVRKISLQPTTQITGRIMIVSIQEPRRVVSAHSQHVSVVGGELCGVHFTLVPGEAAQLSTRRNIPKPRSTVGAGC